MSAVRTKKLGEKYILLDLIGIGGMAEVYRGKLLGDKGFEKQIVIKKLLPQVASDKEMVRLFTGEARLAALLQHENIAATYDFGEIDGNYFLAMEYLSGKDLYTLLQKTRELETPLETRHALMIVSKICEGMDYAHNLKDLQGTPLNIIHRDLTPHNIFITYAGKVKIFDFGVARAEMLDNKTQVGVVKGKLSYMSPEQLSGEKVDWRSDIFSIGILLYEMLSGRRMYSGDTATLIKKCITVDYEPLRNIAPDLEPKLYDIVEQALSRETVSRYQSCQELQKDIDDLLFNMGERTDSKSLQGYIGSLFAQEYQADQKREIMAMEGDAHPEAPSEQDTTVALSPTRAEKTIIAPPTPSPGHRWTATDLFNDKRALLIASLCLAVLVSILLYNFSKRNRTTPLSSQLAHNTTADSTSSSGQNAANQSPSQDNASAPSGPQIEQVSKEQEKRRQEQERELEKQRQEQIKNEQEKQREAEKQRLKRLREEKKDLQLLENRYVGQVKKALVEQRFIAAEELIKSGLASSPDNQALEILGQQVKREKQRFIAELLKKAESRLAVNRLTTPPRDSAVFYYNKILKVTPDSKLVKDGYWQIATRYASLADSAYRKFDYNAARMYISKGLEISPYHSRLLKIKAELNKSGPETFFKSLEKNIDVLEKNLDALLSN